MKINLLKKNCPFILITIWMFSVTLTNAKWVNKASHFTTANRGINEMIAVNSKVAWAIAYDGGNAFGAPITEFTRTTDGGKTWRSGSISNLPEDYLIGIAPISENIA